MLRDTLTIEAAFVTAQIERMKADFPDLLADAELLAGMIEGETDFEKILSRVVDRIRDADTMQEAIKFRIHDLREREERFDRRSRAYRGVALRLMDAAGTRKAELPEATVSVSKPHTRVVVYDIDALPQGTFKLERVAAPAAALRAMIEADGEVPGVRIDTSPPSVSIRTK